MPLAQLSAGFQSLPPLPKANWTLLVLIPRWEGLCTLQDPVSLSNEPSCEAGSFSHHLNCHRFFTVTGFEALFPHAGTLGCTVCLALQLFLLVYLHANVEPPTPPAAASPGLSATACSASCCLATSPFHPSCLSPTGLDNVSSLTPRLSDFHTVQFSVSSSWFLLLNLLSFFWLCKEAHCIYLHLHLGPKRIARCLF